MDLNTNAFRIVNALTTGKKEDSKTSKIARVAGLIGGRARANKLSAEKRAAIAKKAAGVRWGNTEAGQRTGGPDMSEKLLRNLEELAESIRQNTPKVEEQIGTSDPAVVLTAAKYYEALKKLAQE